MPKRTNDFFPAQPFSQLGREPEDELGVGSDAAFYEWMKGDDEEGTMGAMWLFLVEDLREEHNPATIKQLLDDWYMRLPKESFFERVEAIGSLLPPSHPFHQVRRGYS